MVCCVSPLSGEDYVASNKDIVVNCECLDNECDRSVSSVDVNSVNAFKVSSLQVKKKVTKNCDSCNFKMLI